MRTTPKPENVDPQFPRDAATALLDTWASPVGKVLASPGIPRLEKFAKAVRIHSTLVKDIIEYLSNPTSTMLPCTMGYFEASGTS